VLLLQQLRETSGPGEDSNGALRRGVLAHFVLCLWKVDSDTRRKSFVPPASCPCSPSDKYLLSLSPDTSVLSPTASAGKEAGCRLLPVAVPQLGSAEIIALTCIAYAHESCKVLFFFYENIYLLLL